MAKKIAVKIAGEKIPQKHGGALLKGGVKGHRGGTGRPPDAFKELCRQLASGERTLSQVGAILADGTHPQFMAALKWATENGYGKPNQVVEHSAAIDLSASEREEAIVEILTNARKRQKAMVS